MRILFAVVVMGAVATFATLLVAIQVVVSLLPWLVAALVIGAALKVWSHRSAGPRTPTPAVPPSLPAVQHPFPATPMEPRPAGWVLMPVPLWSDSPWAGSPWAGPVQPQPAVIEAEVVREDPYRG